MKDCMPVPPNKNALAGIAENGVNLAIYSPFYTASGLLLLSNVIKDASSIETVNFNCRLTKGDWIQGTIDPIALLRLVKTYSGSRRVAFNFACDDSLHAKAYYCEKKGLLGSANLTAQGFGDNLELLLMLSGKLLEEIKKWFDKHIYANLTSFSQKDLSLFIKQNEAEVNKAKRKLKKIKLGRIQRAGKRLSFPPISEFIDFCARLHNPAADEVVDRFMGKDQLSGHIRNFYYASQQFLSKHNGLINPIAGKSPQAFRLQNMPFKSDWKAFINSSDLSDIPEVRFSARSTPIYLPVFLGGTQVTGGGGIGNLNRVLPLVAKFRKMLGE